MTHHVSPAVRAGLSQREAANELGVSDRTLRRWSRVGYGPNFVRRGNIHVYDRAAVKAFAAGVR